MTAAAESPTLAEWSEPDGVVPRGTLIVLPGRGEQAGIYARLGRRLSADGYRVLVVPEPTTDSEQTTERVRAVLADAGSGPHPRVLVGSDTGALFAAALVADGLPGVDALVLAGLPVASTEGPAGWAEELDARTACPVHLGVLDGAAVRRGALAEPVPAAWIRTAIPERIEIPVLGLHGTADPLGTVDTVRDWYARLGEAELVAIVGGRHDALNDQSHRTAAATVVLFLERLRAGLPEIARRERVRA
ncbi:lysophospholipase [Pseudonocardia sp. NPDC049154]|uniref:alpha/beta hydrolase n=1 Tax=Pseudonocardia sp. NPDC049154 TaxID=3155501 RepID=UPI003401405E